MYAAGISLFDDSLAAESLEAEFRNALEDFDESGLWRGTNCQIACSNAFMGTFPHRLYFFLTISVNELPTSPAKFNMFFIRNIFAKPKHSDLVK